MEKKTEMADISRGRIPGFEALQAVVELPSPGKVHRCRVVKWTRLVSTSIDLTSVHTQWGEAIHLASRSRPKVFYKHGTPEAHKKTAHRCRVSLLLPQAQFHCQGRQTLNAHGVI